MNLAEHILREMEGTAGSSATHAHVIGSSGLGKSRFLEHMIQEATWRDAGFCLIDWAGSLYKRALNYFAYFTPSRPIYLLNPADTQFVSRYNPFVRTGADVGTTVNRRIALTVRPWGSASTNQTPTLERVCRILYHFAIAANQPLPNAALLLDYNHRNELFDYALGLLDTFEHQVARRKLEELRELKTMSQWRDHVGSTDNRILRFTASGPLRRTIGFQEGNIDIEEIVRQNAILLVNLAPMDPMDEDSSKVFAALLLNDFFNAARARPDTDEHFFLFLDEFQEYMSLDLASMLDQVRKGGLHLAMAHQHLGHLAQDPHLRKSIFTNTRVKVVFGGLDVEDATIMAQELSLREINQRDILETFYSRQPDGVEIQTIPTVSLTDGVTDSRTLGTNSSRTLIRGSASAEALSSSESVGDTASWREYNGDPVGSSTGAGHLIAAAKGKSVSASNSSAESISDGESRSQTLGRVHSRTVGESHLTIPKYRDVVSGYVERDRQDRIGLAAERLIYQPERHCTVRIKAAAAEQVIVPFVDDYETSDEIVRPYETQLFKDTGAIPIAAADELLLKSQETFLKSVRDMRKRPAKAKPLKAATKSDSEPPPEPPPTTGPPRI